MPKRRIEYVPAKDVDVEADFKRLYGGSDSNWKWLIRQLDKIKPVEFERRCERLTATDLVKLPPCYLFGRLDLKDEKAWWGGLVTGTFTIEAVVHESYASEYYGARLAKVPKSEQDL